MAVGLRWSVQAQQGNLAFIDTNASPPVIRLYEMPGAWGTGSSATSSMLTPTSSNTYTLVITDDGRDRDRLDHRRRWPAKLQLHTHGDRV